MQALAPFTEGDLLEQEDRIQALEATIVDLRIHRPKGWDKAVNRLASAQLEEYARYDLILSNLR